MPLAQALLKFWAARTAKDWAGVLKWEVHIVGPEGSMFWRLEEMGLSDALRNRVLETFVDAHHHHAMAAGSNLDDHAQPIIQLESVRIELLAKMQLFRDQGRAMCEVAAKLRHVDRQREAKAWFQRARDVGAAHGFFSVECEACKGLGALVILEGGAEEGLDLLRNALVCLPPYTLDPKS